MWSNKDCCRSVYDRIKHVCYDNKELRAIREIGVLIFLSNVIGFCFVVHQTGRLEWVLCCKVAGFTCFERENVKGSFTWEQGERVYGICSSTIR